MIPSYRRTVQCLLAVSLGVPAMADDVSVELDAGTGFVILDDGASVERLRVDETTGNISRNGALFAHTTGGTFVGPSAGNLTSTGSSNAAFGNNAMTRNPGGSSNSAFGSFVMYGLVGGDHNSAFGAGAMGSYSGWSGEHNAAFGSNAMHTVGGVRNSAFGSRAMYYSASGGSRNSAFGFEALHISDYADDNSAFGHRSIRACTNCQENSAFGNDSLSSLDRGNANAAVGSGAGTNLVTGYDNIYLANEGVATESGRIKIGNTAHTATYIEGIDGVTLGTGSAVYIDSANRLGTAVSSSLRTKREVENMGDASAVLDELRPVVFLHRKDVVGEAEAAVLQYGLIAEEVAAVAPQLVTYDDEGEPNSVQYRLLTPLLLNELQRQRHDIAALRARLEALESELASGTTVAQR